ncbi:MAG: ABC transporter ATP-binding protein/permease [Bombilactobacillus mellifer]|uniref:ABC transporter ATP-binding protein n=1 Tax=Bombilactobacillus mellifer TaxID=1218492 RepID=UPI0023F63C52|nr:ABC transporter ATP-binding protein [Bombilactobacillus mellifer]MCT6895227.1 ABC transporter ATP-binding protein/permease [Bombilactobacillus mellifer]
MHKFKGFDRPNYYLALVFAGLIYPLINLLLALVLKRLIDAGVARNLSALKQASEVCLLVCIFLALAVFGSERTKNKFVKHFRQQYRPKVFNQILTSDLQAFNKHSLGDFLTTMTTTLSTIEEKYLTAYFNIVSNVSLLLFSVLGMLFINWQLAIAVLIISLIPLLSMSGLSGKMQAQQKAVLKCQNDYVSKVKDALAGFLVIKSFNIEKQLNQEFQSKNNQQAASEFALAELNNRAISLSNCAGYLVFLVAYGLGMLMVIHGRTSIGGVTAIVQLVNFVVLPLNKLGLEMNNKKAGLAAMATLQQLLDQIHKPLAARQDDLEITQFTTNIKFTHVNFAYPQQGNIRQKVLSNINLQINKGQKYALVGMSGSGKTTLLKLLMRYYQLDTNGTISLDNVNLNQISLASLYQLINIIQQDVYIFDNSLAYNITLGKSFTDQELHEAIKQAGLKPLVDSNPQGMDLQVGEAGNELSGGQKQRISIARALIRKTPILLMDEATAALDQKNTTEIEEAILKIADLTAIVVTHKLNPNLLSKYDAVIFMKDGTITENGPFEELMQQKGDLYNLCSLTMNH